MITYPTTQTHADIPAEVRHSYGLTDDLLRLSIGIEDADDLIEDLKQALRLKMTKYDFTDFTESIDPPYTSGKKLRQIQKSFLLGSRTWILMSFQKYEKLLSAMQTKWSMAIPMHRIASTSLSDWEKEEHGYSFDKEAVVFIEGVVPAISTAIQAFTKEGDAVLINTPVYPPFARSVKLNRRKLIENSLVEKDGLFQIDFDQLEKDIVEQDVKLYVLCNPHNPGGRVWDREVLEKNRPPLSKTWCPSRFR